MKHFCLILFLAVAALTEAQTPVQIVNPCFQNACFHFATSLSLASSASTTVTIQEPLVGTRQAQFNVAVVQCPGQAFSVAQAENGTAATATSGTPIAILPTPLATKSGLVPYTASNVGAGTSLGATLVYVVGNAQVIDLSQFSMSAASANYSLTLLNAGAGSCTGTVDIYWYERN